MQMQEDRKSRRLDGVGLGQARSRHDRAYLDKDAATEIFNTPPDILAWGAIADEVQAVPGGYRASARWNFASGSRQASWLGAHVRVVEADGSQRASRTVRPRYARSCFRWAMPRCTTSGM